MGSAAKISGVIALLVGLWVFGMIGREVDFGDRGVMARARKPQSADA